MTKTILALLAGALCLSAQTLDKHDREFGMSALHASRKLFLDSVAGLSAAQWNFKPTPTSWSIAECAEHIALSEEFLFQLATGKIMQTPAASEKAAQVKGKEDTILKVVPVREKKFQAPEPLKPSGRYSTPQQAVDAFKKLRDEHIAYIEKTQDPLRAHFMENPLFGLLDAYQWIIYMTAHTDRHTNQILEVKANPAFPKK